MGLGQFVFIVGVVVNFCGLYCKCGSLHNLHNVDLQMMQSLTQVQTLLPHFFFFEVIFTTYHCKLFIVKKPSFYKGVFVLERFNFIHGLSFISPLLFGLIISLMNGKIIR